MHMRQNQLGEGFSSSSGSQPGIYGSSLSSSPSQHTTAVATYASSTLSLAASRSRDEHEDIQSATSIGQRTPRAGQSIALRRPRKYYPPLPPQTSGAASGSVRLHPLLETPHEHLNRELDFADDWPAVEAHIALFSGDAATNPVLPSLAVWTRYFPWPVVVFASNGRNYVTLGDVLRAVWTALQHPVTDVAGLDAGHLGLVNSWGRAGHNLYGTVRLPSPPRLSLLRGRTKFGGMGHRHIDGDTWLMELK